VNVAAPAPRGAEAIADLGQEVYQIDTFMAGYDRISAGYLIRADRPCLVETRTAASARVVRDGLARLGIGPADLAMWSSRAEVLMASAQMVWGDRLDQLFGTLAATPAERIRAVEQTCTVDLGGGRRLESVTNTGESGEPKPRVAHDQISRCELAATPNVAKRDI
jgi:hypothetical protein